MLELGRVDLAVDGRPILHDITLRVESGETHVLFGPNGSGKTSLLMAIMGLPRYQVTSGRIRFQGQDLATLSIDERARLGIGLLYQRPPTLRGLRLGDLADICAGSSRTAMVTEFAERLHLGHLLQRNVNDGFSGGELKKSELLQLMLRRPKLALIDEPDAGVDLNSLVLVGETIKHVLEQPSTDGVTARLSIAESVRRLYDIQGAEGRRAWAHRLVWQCRGSSRQTEVQTGQRRTRCRIYGQKVWDKGSSVREPLRKSDICAASRRNTWAKDCCLGEWLFRRATKDFCAAAFLVGIFGNRANSQFEVLGTTR
jgi:Fe-S cluster assembly ATP-binding protein